MKKRLFLVAVLVISSMFLISCACSSEEGTKQDATQGEVAGGYTQERDVTTEDMVVFDEAMEGLAGVSYTPLKVSTQVVAGTNYKFYCETVLVTPDAEEGHAYVTIYQPLEGKAEVVDITEA